MGKFDNYLFRSSANGTLMTNGRAKDSLGAPCLELLEKIYIKEVYGRSEEIKSKFLEKGTLVEEQSLTLLSKVDNKLYFKNKKHFANEWIKGTPDLTKPVIDIKSNWSIFTFFGAEITPAYEWQLRSYMWLTGEKSSELVYCLVNTPEHLIEREERNLFYKMGFESEQDPTYLLAKAELRKNMTFDDIPETKRVKRFTIEHDESKIEELKARVIRCREVLNEMYKQNK